MAVVCMRDWKTRNLKIWTISVICFNDMLRRMTVVCMRDWKTRSLKIWMISVICFSDDVSTGHSGVQREWLWRLWEDRVIVRDPEDEVDDSKQTKDG